MILLCGLGNPGAEYAGTRHNIGFMAADAIARHFNVTFSKQSRLLGKPLFESAALTHAGTRYTVIKPLTFMNNSGSAVAYVAGKLGIAPAQIVIMVDEYNFPVGTVRLSFGGSSGGHNGTQDVIDRLGTRDFWRLRLGISRDFGPGELVQYVLSPFPPNQLGDVTNMLESVQDLKILKGLQTDAGRGR